MRFHIITLFPEAFASYFGVSILARAIRDEKISVSFYNPRDYVRPTAAQAKKKKPYLRVDDVPYGGGAGMVLQAEPILKAVAAAQKKAGRKTRIILFSAKGKQFDQRIAYDTAKKYTDVILIAGRYEGIDERVAKILKAAEISIGPYVLTDGEVPAMAVVSAVARLVPGVIRLESLAEESHWNLLLKKETAGAIGKNGLEHPHYTRPEVLKWKGKSYRVPKVLLSGNHKNIEDWRMRRNH
ncbi:MAG: tRNA (guanosine(37)-N1)-methyltransferase TrmD [Patescibacteria group bacterium]|nr:tRNA (guanosine(37)-N1)-methyltransferase TrmD [Patescibacteria group bacterium]MDE1946156.1 tRNA (guanosine(37)-N1)-methyltransferase TrmD [Patescibacteria group bacterium]